MPFLCFDNQTAVDGVGKPGGFEVTERRNDEALQRQSHPQVACGPKFRGQVGWMKAGLVGTMTASALFSAISANASPISLALRASVDKVTTPMDFAASWIT